MSSADCREAGALVDLTTSGAGRQQGHTGNQDDVNELRGRSSGGGILIKDAGALAPLTSCATSVGEGRPGSEGCVKAINAGRACCATARSLVVARHGKPLVALVPAEDLREVEGPGQHPRPLPELPLPRIQHKPFDSTSPLKVTSRLGPSRLLARGSSSPSCGARRPTVVRSSQADRRA